jgi:endonuclease/exonuclease/phosphatase family metal-dependent hydrolase
VPLGKGTVHLLPNEPGREQRIAFAVPLTLGGRELVFASTHLDHQTDDLRQRQAAKLTEAFASANTPVILAGDLNATPDSRPLALLTPKWAIATGDKLLTIPSVKPAKQIDYVLHRPAEAFKLVAVTVIDEPVASDHRPILAVLEPVAK